MDKLKCSSSSCNQVVYLWITSIHIRECSRTTKLKRHHRVHTTNSNENGNCKLRGQIKCLPLYYPMDVEGVWCNNLIQLSHLNIPGPVSCSVPVVIVAGSRVRVSLRHSCWIVASIFEWQSNLTCIIQFPVHPLCAVKWWRTCWGSPPDWDSWTVCRGPNMIMIVMTGGMKIRNWLLAKYLDEWKLLCHLLLNFQQSEKVQ